MYQLTKYTMCQSAWCHQIRMDGHTIDRVIYYSIYRIEINQDLLFCKRIFELFLFGQIQIDELSYIKDEFNFF